MNAPELSTGPISGQNWTDGHSFDAFETGITQSGSTTNPFRYVGSFGYYLDSETGLDLLTYRYYDAAIGRFLTKDPIGFQGGDWNVYGYVGNSPTDATDPRGLKQDWWCCRWFTKSCCDPPPPPCPNPTPKPKPDDPCDGPRANCEESADHLFQDCLAKAKSGGQGKGKNLYTTCEALCCADDADNSFAKCFKTCWSIGNKIS